MKKKGQRHNIPSFGNFLNLKSHLEPHPNRELVGLSFKILVDTYNELGSTCSATISVQTLFANELKRKRRFSKEIALIYPCSETFITNQILDTRKRCFKENITEPCETNVIIKCKYYTNKRYPYIPNCRYFCNWKVKSRQNMIILTLGSQKRLY